MNNNAIKWMVYERQIRLDMISRELGRYDICSKELTAIERDNAITDEEVQSCL
jgi:hypothetical protein